MNQSKSKKGGFLVLTMVLLVSVTILAVATGIFLRSISVVAETADAESSLKAWGAVTACGEYALGQLASSTDSVGWSYAGGETRTVGGETCHIYSVTTSGTAKQIMASSTVALFTKKIVIEVATNTPKILINSWAEVADF